MFLLTVTTIVAAKRWLRRENEKMRKENLVPLAVSGSETNVDDDGGDTVARGKIF